MDEFWMNFAWFGGEHLIKLVIDHPGFLQDNTCVPPRQPYGAYRSRAVGLARRIRGIEMLRVRCG